MVVSLKTRENDQKVSGLLNRFEALYWKPELNEQEQKEYFQAYFDLIQAQKNSHISGTCRRDLQESIRIYQRKFLYGTPKLLSAS